MTLVLNTPVLIDKTIRTREQVRVIDMNFSPTNLIRFEDFVDKYSDDVANRVAISTSFKAEIALHRLGYSLSGVLVSFGDIWTKDCPPTQFQIVVSKNGTALYTTEYSQGIGHCLYGDERNRNTYGKPVSNNFFGQKIKFDEREVLRKARPATPTIANVLYCLMMDASGVQGTSFKNWAAEYGYSDDSIKAQKIYMQCQETLDAVEKHLEVWQEILQDY